MATSWTRTAFPQSFTNKEYVVGKSWLNIQALTLPQGLLYLLRKSYSMIYFMITSSEPVSEALLPIYNQLMTLKRCLKEVQRSGGVSSPREIYPYSMKVSSSKPDL